MQRIFDFISRMKPVSIFFTAKGMYSAQATYGNQYFFIGKQLVGALVGLVVMVALTFIKIDVIKSICESIQPNAWDESSNSTVY